MKVTMATTLKEGFVVGMRSMPGNPWDGHTLAETVEQASIPTDKMPKTVIVDRGYQGVLWMAWRFCDQASGAASRTD